MQHVINEEVLWKMRGKNTWKFPGSKMRKEDFANLTLRGYIETKWETASKVHNEHVYMDGRTGKGYNEPNIA